MIGASYESAVLIDTSATVALVDEADSFHSSAAGCFERLKEDVVLCAVDVSAHESFTRLRYNKGHVAAKDGFQLLRATAILTLDFLVEDEQKALQLAQKYQDKSLSFHDALCAAVMMRHQMFRVFSFDSDFWAFGFDVLPGETRTKKQSKRRGR
jgi:predicted nucleic acid-binding protein